MHTHWKTFLNEMKRIYNIIFENRPIDDIRNDFYSNKWISKHEKIILLEDEKEFLMQQALRYKNDYDLLMNNFNLMTQRDYSEHRKI
jgi:hypothetical protein